MAGSMADEFIEVISIEPSLLESLIDQ